MTVSSANVWNPKTLTSFDADSKTAVESFITTTSQVTFNLLTFQYTLNTNSLLVYHNGGILRPGIDYVELSETSFGLNITVGFLDQIVAVGYIAVGVADVPAVLPLNTAFVQFSQTIGATDFDGIQPGFVESNG